MMTSLSTHHKQRRPLVSRDPYAFVVILYTASAAGLLANLFVPVGPSVTADGTTTSFIMAWVAVWLLSLTGLRQMPSYRPGGTPEIILPALILYAIISSIWSTSPNKSITYGSVVALNYLFAVTSVQRLGFERTFKLFAITLIAMSCGGFLLGIIGAPSAVYYDPHHRYNLLGLPPLRGLSNHKITAGIYAAIGATAALTVLSRWRLPAFLGCSLMVISSGSTAALAIEAILLIALTIFSSKKLAAPLLWPLLLYAASTVTLLAVRFGPELLELAGRDPTFTGRTVLWEFGFRAFSERPILGWGYLGYFGSYEFSNAILDYRKMANYDIPHFHNSYIEMLVELGLVGLTAFMICLLATIGRSLESASRHAPLVSTILVVYLLYAFFTNTFLRYNDLSTVLFMICVVGLSKRQSARFANEAEK
jgi:exopolysaccharide production protein ExoQ